MKRRIVFVTGTDTGVGKTVLASLWVRHLRAQGVKLAALKPFCSGGRDDAFSLRAALGGELSLGEINPWHFRAPLAPFLAARREGRRILLSEVMAHIRKVSCAFETLIIEGAGGLLSPLGQGFDARDLIIASRATPVVVCPDRLGAINQTLLVLAALPRPASAVAQIVLIAQPQPDSSTTSNLQLLRETLGTTQVHRLPRLTAAQIAGRVPPPAKVHQLLDALLR